ncbi:MAG: hypothetical protein V4808_09400 [Pseudomonadota bacterium]
MPLYFFHLDHGAREIPDTEGSECADPAAALVRAIEIIREMVALDLREGRIDLDWRLRIMDQAGMRLATVPFADVLGGKPIALDHRPPLRQ